MTAPTPASRPVSGFTLVEMMVATAVLAIILAMTLSMTGSIAALFNRTRAKIDTFQEARAGFEVMTRKVSQSMLNTYWDYDYAPSDPSHLLPPKSYARQSELHFVAGPLKEGANPLLPASEIKGSTHGIFFQAPTGFSSPPAGQPVASANLPTTLNSLGYYLDYTSDLAERPKFLQSGKGTPPERWRYRLFEMQQPTEYLEVYNSTSANKAQTALDWFRNPLGATKAPGTPPVKRTLAENVIALIISPHRSPHDPAPSGAPAQIAPKYFYDSRLYSHNGGTALAEVSRNQLPPMVQVTMVAIDATSAGRLADRQSDPKVPPVDELGLDKLFKQPSTSLSAGPDEQGDQYRDDLKTLEKTLVDLKITYRVFATDISILQAKWSEN